MNSLQLQIAFRYLLSKKSTNAINVITLVTMVAMALISASFILVLSVFNGFEGLVISLYKSFNPDILVTTTEGKVFNVDEDLVGKIAIIEGVDAVSEVVEENAILKYNDHEYIATIKGVDSKFAAVTGVPDKVVEGDYRLFDEGVNYLVLGAGVAGALDIDLEDRFNSVMVYVPRRGKETVSADPSQAFIRKPIVPAGIFSIQQEFDSKYAIAPLDFVRELLNYSNQLTALEVKLKPGANAAIVKQQIQNLTGASFKTEDRFEQNRFLYRVMRLEKWAVFAIITLILLIAAFNIIGSLSMLVIEKTKDIAILKTLGADNGMIRRIFLFEGLLTSLIGSIIGVLIAVILCVIQIVFGVIKLGGSGTFVIDAYPVEMRWEDFAFVAATIIIIAVATSWIPAQRAASRSALIAQE